MDPVAFALVNGRIRTGDPRRPVADALAVSGSTLTLVGSSAEVRKLAGGEARVIDMRGGIVIAVPDADAVFRRGARASFAVIAQTDETERFRMIDGEILLDELT
ncbi:MAG TPA: hypothetical protein VE861_04900 [Gemmatimonadaceae bacterium]|nr:hypothetical protein [Gemmatimonadaceae bacterium]